MLCTICIFLFTRITHFNLRRTLVRPFSQNFNLFVSKLTMVLAILTRSSSRRLQQACCQPVVECRRQAACQMRSRGRLRPVVTWLLQTAVRSAANCCDRTAAALLETNLLHPVVTEPRQCCCGQNCSRL